jgi:hypothetical protein
MSLGSISEFPKEKRQSGNVQREESLQPGKQRLFILMLHLLTRKVPQFEFSQESVSFALKAFKEISPAKIFGFIQPSMG